MRRALVALVVLALPAAARAGSHCHEVSPIVGYQQCGWFGSWSFGAMAAWEVGVSALRFDADHVDATANAVGADGSTTTYHLTAAPGDDRAVTATGMRSRLSVGFGRTFYVASQLDLASITGGPHLVANVAERGGTTIMPTAAGGALVQGEMLFGAHRRYGQLTIAAEAGPGVRFASYTPAALPGAKPPMQAWFVVDVHPKLDLWLAPNVSLGVVSGFDLVQHDGFSAALVLGLHVTPYDMAR